MSTKISDARASRGAVLQFEIDRPKFLNKDSFCESTYGETPNGRLYAIARTAATDVLRNGGTLVIVATPEKVTIVQRPDAEDQP